MRVNIRHILQGEGLRHLPVALMLALILLSACREGKKVDVAAGLNPAKMPTMTTKNVATFISDSGVIQYKIVAPLWLVYDQRDTPYWSFPKGLYLQKFDRNYKQIAFIAADSARYFSDMRLWRLDGNVELHRQPKDLFLTQQLFWDERDHKIYSDSFIHIETPTQMLEGYGFVSNDRVTNYRILKPKGMFPFNPNSTPGGKSGGAGMSPEQLNAAPQPGGAPAMPSANAPV